MINRILIRIKVVQLLYSYLLLDQQFELEPSPENPTKEKRFAYSLYLDLLLLLCRTANRINGPRGSHPLADSRFVQRIMDMPVIKARAAKYRTEDFDLSEFEVKLADEIAQSPIYKNFLKSGKEGNADILVWQDIFNQFLTHNPELSEILDRRPDYSPRGVDRAKEMVETTFRNLYTAQQPVKKALDTLRASLEKSRELYFRLLSLPVELTRLRELQLDEARHKFVVTEEDRNPNLRFVENQLVAELQRNETLNEYLGDHKVSWLTEERHVMESVLQSIMASELYRDYMSRPTTDFATDCDFWKQALRQIVYTNSDFLEMLEDTSVFWNDDLETIGTFVLKTLRKFSETGSADEPDERGGNPVMGMYKDEEDASFGAELFSYAAKDREYYRHVISECVDQKGQWRLERLALMDVVILITALAEIEHYPKIPITVSVNEYIEMARYYSTPKSAQFVHGILGSAIDMMKGEGRVLKQK